MPRPGFHTLGKRDLNERDLIDEYRKQGATVFQITKPADLLVGYCGQTELVEVKQAPGPRGGDSHCRLTPDEERFRAGWRGSYEVVQTRDDVRSHCQRIRARAHQLGFGRLDTAQAGKKREAR